MSNKPFTLADAFEVQREQLAEWRGKLNPACYDALEKHVQVRNAELNTRSDASPYDVYRGTDLQCFVSNWQPKPLPLARHLFTIAVLTADAIAAEETAGEMPSPALISLANCLASEYPATWDKACAGQGGGG